MSDFQNYPSKASTDELDYPNNLGRIRGNISTDNKIICPECGVNKVVERTRLKYSLGKALLGGLILAGIALCGLQIYAVSYWAGNLATSIPRIPMFLDSGGDNSMHFICAGGLGIIALLMILLASRTTYTYYHCLACKKEWEKTL